MYIYIHLTQTALTTNKQQKKEKKRCNGKHSNVFILYYTIQCFLCHNFHDIVIFEICILILL